MLITDSVSVVLVGQFGNKNGDTALHEAAAYNSLEVAEALIAANANLDIKDQVRAGCSWLGAGY